MSSKREQVLSLDPNRVRPFAEQPREYFDKDELISLELSIKQRGQLQPVMVRMLTGRHSSLDHDYELVDGQRRWHACIRLGIQLRAVVIDPANEEDQFEISVAANFQRAGHTPMEIAKAIDRMCDPDRGNRTVEYVATLFGKSGPWVYLQRRLMNLVPEIQARLEPGSAGREFPVALASELARLPKEQQVATLEDIEARGLTTPRAIDKIRQMLLGGEPEPRKKASNYGARIEQLVRGTIQRADLTLDRMGPDDFRIMVGSLIKSRKFESLKETVMTAIGRLEVIHRRLAESANAIRNTPQPVPTPAKKAPARDVYSIPFNCPKCRGFQTRFRRAGDADPQKDFWTCVTNGCQLKISHYNIKIDRSYQPETGKAATA